MFAFVHYFSVLLDLLVKKFMLFRLLSILLSLESIHNGCSFQLHLGLLCNWWILGKFCQLLNLFVVFNAFLLGASKATCSRCLWAHCLCFLQIVAVASAPCLFHKHNLMGCVVFPVLETEKLCPFSQVYLQ